MFNTQDTTSNSEFTNCTNNGEIYATGSENYMEGSEGGILSEVTGYVIIKNATNNGQVLSSSNGGRHIGGIVGNVTGAIEIKDSVNKGAILGYQYNNDYF